MKINTNAKLLDFPYTLPPELSIYSCARDVLDAYHCELELSFHLPVPDSEDEDDLKIKAILSWFEEMMKAHSKGNLTSDMFSGRFTIPLDGYELKVHSNSLTIERDSVEIPQTIKRVVCPSNLAFIKFKEASIRLTKDDKPCALDTMTQVFRSNGCNLRHYFSF